MPHASIDAAAKIFFSKRGRLPLGIDEMVRAQILEKYPRDPWDHLYRYWIVREKPTFVSLGADNACGGEDEDADLVPEGTLPGECAWRSR